MKIGDIVTVKDSVGYNSYMQNLVGHIGVVCSETIKDAAPERLWVKVHILGKTRPIVKSDLEVIHEDR